MASEKLNAARRKGDLTAAIGALREEAGTDSAPTSGREQLGVEDAAIRVAAGLTGKSDVERRAALREVRPGATVTAKGVAKTLLSRAEKIDRVKAWASSLTEEQRTEYMIGEKYGALSENAQDVIAEAFGQIEDREYEDSIGVANVDLDAELVDIDQLPEDETESVGDSFEVQEGEDVESFDVADPWEGDIIS
jgi:hypothetical protein